MSRRCGRVEATSQLVAPLSRARQRGGGEGKRLHNSYVLKNQWPGLMWPPAKPPLTPALSP
ncbi:hypothetical protein CBM2615_B200026 [Cupriavidus taiwanensis]|uniref:Uncharacterized protein n=1 Tax=Cupriavidus taiwanensis TaxID=164546 RepID=A0A976B2B8_9BURK|nr:hypothetical protein CBM2614_B210026 [Cupriavidus taiwanensis]SOZ68484.1 hypothetical protein CBM2615_B200026 [Cupriavidus taiwanensis]SOZ71550.1 hypothetical protein CBM2613_B180025 [Cupriavidus taiwanensis]SPA09340.1 hypothetical protein CBM2625_B180025 [Cupriavidus taiwanensis]